MSIVDADTYDPADYDPRSPEVKQNIEQHFEQLRAKCPVHHHKFSGDELAELNDNPYVNGPVTDLYSFMKHADVVEILQNPDRFLSIEGAGPERMKPVEGTGMLVWSDGDAHRRSRKICLPAFSPKNIAPLAPMLQTRIDELIDGFADKGEIDLVSDFTLPVTSGMIAHLIGLPVERAPEILEWGFAIISTFGGDDDAYQKGLWALGKMGEFLAEVGPDRARRLAEGEDLHDAVTHVLTSTDDNGSHFSPEEAVVALSQFLGAGIESSATSMANGIYLLCTNPDERRKLEENPALIGTAVEEILRYMAPIEGTCRTTATDMEFAGHTFKAGQKIRPVYASANMDEDAFEDPKRFKIDRERSELRKHVAFGAGVHSCLGAALARQELKLAIGTLLRRIPTLELHPDRKPTRNPIFLVHGFDSLPVRWDPATVLPAVDPEKAAQAALGGS
ncbi:cytochrome P450 [Pseudonocardia spinosispora]|uniref:cytochrome P450 n=1 Tax=Pseudonocardia spinosispora TaxID=103441 RepID=UPI0004142763|nr:cytochrome P450 [Pseudonocardia spinosispora]